MRVDLKSVKFRHSHHYTLVGLEYTPNRIERFFGAKSRTVYYLGHKTVWWTMPGMKPVTRPQMLRELAAFELKGKYIKSRVV